MLVDNHEMFFMTKLDFEMAVMQYWQALAKLEQAVGTDIK